MRSERSGIGTGILLITIGLLFMADRQGLMGFHSLWPVIIIVMGVVTIVFPSERPRVGVVAGRRGRYYRSGRRSSGIWMILVGVLLLANQNHWMSFRDSWPLFIVAGGLALIFGNLGRRSPIVDTTDPQAGSGQAGAGTDGQGGGSWR
jgi:hypothetical protein